MGWMLDPCRQKYSIQHWPLSIEYYSAYRYVFERSYFKCHDVELQTWDVYTLWELSIGYLPRRSHQYSTRFQP